MKKKKLIVALLLIVAAVLLLLAMIPLFLWFFQEPEPTYSFKFADPSLSTNIYADEDYMDLDHAIYYTTGQGGYEFKNALREEDYTSYNKAVQLLIKLVQAAQDGDAEAYNACFSKEYIEKEGEFEPFTMQKIYDINIREYTSSSKAELPDTYKELYVYGLSYKIKDNNGSLRNDMGSDASREQFISVVIDQNGQASIYGIRVMNYRPAS